MSALDMTVEELFNSELSQHLVNRIGHARILFAITITFR